MKNQLNFIMKKLTLISLLERQIEQEIVRLEQSELIDWEKEQKTFRVYEELTKKILELWIT